jgi:hypothetical protein
MKLKELEDKFGSMPVVVITEKVGRYLLFVVGGSKLVVLDCNTAISFCP